MGSPQVQEQQTLKSKQDARRMTRQRQVILDAVTKLHNHPSADEIYVHVRKRLPRISLATVYRNLEVLSEQGLIHKIGHCDVQMRFDTDLYPHFHLRCVGCGKIVDAPVEPCEQLEEAVRSMGDLDVLGYRLEFLYKCEDCRTADSQSTDPPRSPAVHDVPPSQGNRK